MSVQTGTSQRGDKTILRECVSSSSGAVGIFLRPTIRLSKLGVKRGLGADSMRCYDTGHNTCGCEMSQSSSAVPVVTVTRSSSSDENVVCVVL